jgi:Arc/MetJ family transcription regulator
MRTTVNLNDELLAKARKITGIDKTTALANHALKIVVQREAARRLALLGGSDPNAQYVVREREDIE